MTAVLECANSGETEAIMYMKHLNKKQKALIFDFSIRSRETNESVYHLAAKNDQYHIIELFPDTNANILSLDREFRTPRQIINDNWENITPKQKRELLKRRLLHQNLISCQKKRPSISFSSTATSTQFINSKLSSRMSLLASSKRRKPNDDEISIEF